MVSAPNYSLLLIMACFWLVYLVVSTQLVKPLGAILDERKRRAEEAHGLVDDARRSFEVTVARCEEDVAAAAKAAQRERAELRAAGESARRATLESAREDGQKRLVALQSEIEQAATQARQALQQRGEALARDLAEKLLGRKVTG